MQAYVILRPPPGGRRISTSTRLPSHPLIAAPLAATLPPELSATASCPQPPPLPQSLSSPKGICFFLISALLLHPPLTNIRNRHPFPPSCPQPPPPLPKVCHPRKGSAFSCSLPLPFAPRCSHRPGFVAASLPAFLFGRLHPHSHPMPPLIRRIPQSFEHKPHISNNPNRLQNII
jgi:hypothetical protein